MSEAARLQVMGIKTGLNKKKKKVRWHPRITNANDKGCAYPSQDQEAEARFVWEATGGTHKVLPPMGKDACGGRRREEKKRELRNRQIGM